MASSTPPYAWRVTGKPKRPHALFFYCFDMYGEVGSAIWNLIWKTFFVLFYIAIFEAFLLFFNTTPAYIWIALCISIVVVGGIGLWLSFSDDWTTAKQSYSMDMEKYQEQLSILKQKHPLPIIGHKQFRRSVEKVLDELQTRAPHRYREVIEYFPKAEYNTNLTAYDDWNKKASGRADGYFSIDGSGSTSKQLNTYEWFRFVFLHEVGHKVEYRDYESAEEKEKTADSYANMVLVEMGFRRYR